MQIGNFNSEHITNLANQLKHNTDPDVIKIIGAQHSKQIQDILSAISKEQSTLAKNMPPITKVPIPNKHTRAITKWANKVAAGVAMPQVKAQTGYASHLAAAGSAISTITSTLNDLREAITAAKDIDGLIKKELLESIAGALPESDATSDLINSSLEQIMNTLGENQDTLNEITGGNIQVDTSSVNNFITNINTYSTSIDDAMTNLFSAVRPSVTVLPTVSGNVEVGQVLTATAGTWEGTSPITYHFQWQSDGVDIPGANLESYTLKIEDRGKPIRIAVSAENLAAEITEHSANTANVIMRPENTRIPAVSGTLGVGNTVTANSGQWYSIKPISAPTYQWYANNVAISGANANSYLITVAEQGKPLMVSVTVTNSDGATTANSNPTSVIP